MTTRSLKPCGFI